MRDMMIRNGLADTKLLNDIQRPMELDFEAFFRTMEEDAITGLLRAVEDGQTPSQAISSVVQAITERKE